MLPIKTILFPTDFSPRSEFALRLAGSLARDYGARLLILHVVTPPSAAPMNGVAPVEAEDSRDKVRAMLGRLHAADHKVQEEHLLVEGDPVREILRVARETRTDVIVMATHGWTGVARLLMGSVAEGVVRKSQCPVLSVKAPMAAEKPAKKAKKSDAALVPAGRRPRQVSGKR